MQERKTGEKILYYTASIILKCKPNLFPFPCFLSGLMYVPSSTRASQGIVSPEYVTFQPSQWLSATPNELGQCLTGTVLMFFMCRDANNREYRSASTLHLPMCCRTDKYYRLMYICTNSSLQNVEEVGGGGGMSLSLFLYIQQILTRVKNNPTGW